VLEASHAGVPLLVLTADRPPQLIGTGANQTVVQPGIFGDAVRLALSAGPASDPERENGPWRAAVGRAVAAALGTPPGPVHVNVPFAEPLVPDGGAAPAGRPGGVPWTAAYIDTIGDPTCDLRSNIAAESRAKIIYERLINCTDDPGVKEALGFLMTREVAHQQQFEKALYSIEPNFPPGKLAGMPQFTNVYFNMSVGDGDTRGPWNNEPTFEYRDAQAAVDGGSGMPEVSLGSEELQVVEKAAMRLQSKPGSDPLTGAMLGMGGANGSSSALASQMDPKAAQANAQQQMQSGSTEPPGAMRSSSSSGSGSQIE